MRRDTVWRNISWLCNFAEPGRDLMRVRAALGLLESDDSKIMSSLGKFGFVDTSGVNLRLRWPLSALPKFTRSKMLAISKYYAASQVSESSTPNLKYVGSLAGDGGAITWGFEVAWFLSDASKKEFVDAAVRIYEKDDGLPANSLSINSKHCGARGSRFHPTEAELQREWRHNRGKLQLALVVKDTEPTVGLT